MQTYKPSLLRAWHNSPNMLIEVSTSRRGSQNASDISNPLLLEQAATTH